MKKDILCWSLFLALILISLAAAIPSYAVAETDPAIDNEIAFNFELKNRFNIKKDILDALQKKGKPLVLYFNNLPLKGTEVTVDKETLEFFLERTSDTSNMWKQLWKESKTLNPTVTISLGVVGDTPTKIEDGKVYKIILIKKIKLWWGVGFLTILVLLVVMAKKTEILRNSGPKPAGGDRTYSLALLQMALWFVVIIGSYIFLWLITGQMDTITESVLGLMGISSATALGATLIDSGKSSAATSENQKLRGEKDALNTRLNELDVKITNLSPGPEKDASNAEKLKALTRVNEIDSKLKSLPQVEGVASNGWLMDVLSDGNGISLHRFQMLIWTLVLIGIFFTEVYNKMAMPTFSSTLLALMGISSGTYIGFKFPEQNVSSAK
ncbi:MAG: hypothetical protein LUQ69_09555 [Methanoregulaceae archaeon]|nr:hypothetical protein [Methanoregulaceae archaeon]